MLLKNPQKIINHFEEVLKNILKDNQYKSEVNSKLRFRISFIGNLGLNTITPRGLKANMLNKLILLKGSVNFCSKK